MAIRLALCMSSEKYSGVGFRKISLGKPGTHSSHSAMCDSIYDAFENTNVTPFALISSLMPAFQAFRVPEI